MVLVCNDPAAAAEVLDGLPSAPNAVASSRLAPLHGRGGPRWEELADDERYRRVRETLTRLEPEPELGLGQ